MTLVALNLRDAHTVNLGRVALAVSFVLVTLAGNDAVGQSFTVWAYRHSAMVLGVLVLLIYFAALVIGRSRHEQRSVVPRYPAISWRSFHSRHARLAAVKIGPTRPIRGVTMDGGNRLQEKAPRNNAELNERQKKRRKAAPVKYKIAIN
jgi:hypothetical protein